MFRLFAILGALLYFIYKFFRDVEITETKNVEKITLKWDGDSLVETNHQKDSASTDDSDPDNGDIIDELAPLSQKEQKEKVKELTNQLHIGESDKPAKKNDKTELVKKQSIETNKYKNLNDRQAEIMELFDKNEKVDTDLLSGKLSGVTTRTLRRDLDFIESLGLVKKVGKTKGSYYQKA